MTRLAGRDDLKICGIDAVGRRAACGRARARRRSGSCSGREARATSSRSAPARSPTALPSDVTTVGVFVNEPIDEHPPDREDGRASGWCSCMATSRRPMSDRDRAAGDARGDARHVSSTPPHAWPADTTLLLDSTDPFAAAGPACRGRLVARGGRGARAPHRAGRRADAGEHRGSDRDRAAVRRGCVVGSRVGPGVKDFEKVSQFSDERARRVRASGDP